MPADHGFGSEAEAERRKRFPHPYVRERCPETLHGRAVQSRFGDDEIIMLVLRRDETETVLPCDGLDRDAPIGTVLRDGDGDGVVRFRLRPIAGRSRAVQ